MPHKKTPPTEVVCEGCEKPFISTNLYKRFCTTTCRNRAADERRNVSQPERRKVHPKTCEYCGNDFLGRESTAQFCSLRCTSLHGWATGRLHADMLGRGENSGNWKGGRRASRLRRFYNLTTEQYEALLSAQGGVCAVCGCAPEEARRLSVDHDHTTGAVRGLLCNGCNVGIGYFGDDSERLRAAAEYLLRHASLADAA